MRRGITGRPRPGRASNVSQQVTLTGKRLTVVVGTNQATGDMTPIAFLGVAQSVGAPTFSISASPATLSIAQGNQGTSTISTAISGGFNSAISLSASGVPSGTTVSFNPNPIPAPGAGTSTMTITVGSSTPAGYLPHHRDWQRWRHPTKHYGHADGDGATTAEFHDFGFTSFA